MAKKKTKEKEQVKQAWTASDYLENRKKRVEGAKSYSAPKGETAGQIRTRSIVQNAGEGYSYKRPGLTVSRDLVERVARTNTQADRAREQARAATNPVQSAALDEYKRRNYTRLNNQRSMTVPRNLVNRVAQNADNGVAGITRKYAIEGSAPKDTSFMTDNLAAREASRRNDQREAAAQGKAEAKRYDKARRAEMYQRRYEEDLHKKDDKGNIEAYKYMYDAKLPDETGIPFEFDGQKTTIQLPRIVEMFTDPELNKAKSLPYNMMTENEQDIYRYTLGKYGQAAATDYLETLEESLNQRLNDRNYALNEYIASKHPVVGTATNVLASYPSSIMGYGAVIKNALSEDKISPNDPLLRGTVLQEATQSGTQKGVRDAIRAEEGSAKAAISDFLVGTGLSAVNSVVQASTLPEPMVLANFSGSAMGSSIRKTAQDPNSTKDQTTATALASGIAEAFFEKFSLENLQALRTLPPVRRIDYLKNFVKQGGIEASEEVATECANILSDLIINDDNSDAKKRYRENLENGMEPTDALANTLSSLGKDVALAGLGGWLSGGVTSGSAMALGTYERGRNIGRDASNYSGSEQSYYADVANRITDNLDTSTEEGALAQSMAQDYADRVSKGESITTEENGYLGNAIDAAIEASTEKGQTFEYTPDANSVDAEDSSGNVQQQVSDVVNAAVDTLLSERKIEDTSESTPDEAKNLTETLVNDIQKIEFNSKKLDNNSIDNVSQETPYETGENKNTVTENPEYNDSVSVPRENEQENRLRELASDSINSNNVEKELERRATMRFKDDPDAGRVYNAFFEDFADYFKGKPISGRALVEMYDTNMAKAYEAGLNGRALSSLDQDADFRNFDKAFPDLTDVIWEMGNNKISSKSKEAKKEFRAAYGAQGQAAFDRVVRANANLQDDIKAFNRIYNAGRFGKDISEAGDLTWLGERNSREAFEAGAKDMEEEIGRLSKNVERFKKNPRRAARGVFVDATEKAAPKALNKVMKKFSEKVPFSFVVVDTRNRKSLDSALKQLKKQGLVEDQATVERVFMGGASGAVDTGRAFVVIDINTSNFLNTMGHEITHIARIYDPEGYRTYAQYVLDKLSKTKGYDLDLAIAKMQEDYRKQFGQELSRETAEEEIVAEAAAFLNDEEIVRELASKNRTFAERIRDWLGAVADMIKELMDNSTTRAEARALKKDYEIYKHAAELWAKMIDAAADTYSGNAMDAAELETSIRNQLDLSEGLGSKVKVPGNPMSIEEIFSLDDELMDKSDKYDEATRNAWKNIIEAKDFVSLGFPKDDWYYTLTPSARKEYAYQLTHFDKMGAIGDSRYKSDDMNRLYDELVVNTPSEGVDVTVVKTEDMIGSLPEETRFQMDKPIEKTKDLIAVHNLTTEQLLANIGLGGFPSPSIAIIKDSMAHTKYGDTSVLFNRETIDPEFMRKNKVYGGDAWTPTFPRIEYKVNDKKLKQISKKIESLAGMNVNTFGHVGFDEDNVSEALSGKGTLAGTRYADAPIVKLAYLNDKGVNVDLKYTEETLNRKIDNSQLKELDKYFSDEELKTLASDSDYGYEHSDDLDRIRKHVNEVVAESNKDKIDSIRKKYEETGKPFFKKNMDHYMNWFDEYTFRGDDLYDLANSLLKYRENGIGNAIDTYATTDYINDLMESREEDYKAWINSFFEGIVEKSGLWNGKDIYTSTGNRRSWEATHDDVTLENIVKAMNREDAKGDAFFSAMGIKAIATRDFSSIEDIHKHENQLQDINEEDYKKLLDEHSSRYTAIVNELIPKNSHNEFIEFEKISNIIADTIREKNGVKAIDKELRKWIPSIKPDTAQKLVDLMNDIADMPYGYFEAKPQRAVYLDEIAGVVLPDTASQQLIDALNQKGIDYKQYEAGNDTDRTTKLNDYLEEKPEIRFQIGSYSVNGIDYKVSRDGEDAISENGSVVPILTSKILAKSEMNTGNINDIEDKIELILRELNGKEVVIKSSGERVVFDFDFADEYVRSKSSVGLRKTNTRRAKFNAVSKIKEIIINADNQRYEENIKGDKKSNADRGLYKYDVSFWTVTDNGYDSYTGELVVRLDRDGTDYAYDIVKIKKTAVARIENEGSRGVGPQSVTNKISQSKKKNKKINRFNKRFRYQLDTSGRNLSSEQAEFFADSKVRDEDGRLMVMYHGTPNGSFNVFRNGINFFSPNKEYASWYESPSQSSRTAGKTAEAPRTYEVYLNMTHPFDIRNAEDRKAFIDDYVKGGWALGIDPYVPYKDTTKTGLPSWEEADNIYEWMEENDLLDEYDGILVDEGSTESGFDRGISYVTFNPNQIKNVDNENPTDSDDIRYQIDVPSEMLFDENTGDMRSEQANIYLTNMLQASKDLTPSEKDIKKVVKEITDAYNSKMSKKELTRQLSDLYTYMRTNEHVDGEQVSETINAIARQVIREATFTDEAQQKTWDDFRKEMRNTDIYVSPDFVRDIDPDGMMSLRKRYFGRVNLTSNPEKSGNDGIRTYLSLQQLFPDIYTRSVDDIMSDADAINEILYGFEKARPREWSAFGDASTEDEAAQALAERIMDAYFEVGNESVKTQYQKTYKQLREEMKEDIIREYTDSLRAIEISDSSELSKLRSSYTAGDISADAFIVRKTALEDYRRQQDEAARNLYKTKRDKYVDRIQRNKYKDDIIKTSKQLAKMIITPTDKQHIPTEMVKPISNVLQFIDFSSNRVNPDGSLPKRTVDADQFHNSINNILGILNKIDKNESVYESNGETSYLVIDPDLMQNLRELSESFAENDELKDNIDNLSTQNLRTVAQTLRALRQMVNNANKFISAGRYESVSEIAQRSISDFDHAITKKGRFRQKVDFARRLPVINMFDDLLTSGMLDTYTFTDTLGDTGHILYDDVREGLNRKIRNTQTAISYMEDTMERNDVSVKERNKWENDLIEVELKAVPIGGSTPEIMKVKLSAAQIMSLYLLNKRGQARMHLYANETTNNIQNGGFILEPSGRNKLEMDDKHVFKVSEAEVDQLISRLTPRQKAVADDIGRFLTEVTSRWGNEVTQKLYGYNKFEAKNYFPIKVDNSTIATTSSSLENAMFLLKNIGQTKTVQQRAYNPLTLQNIFDVYTAQADDMGSYNAFVTSTADLQMWINYKGKEGNVKRSLTNAYGQKALEYYMNLLKDINMPRENGSKWDKLLGSAIGLQRGGAIWGNLRVAIQQPFAYIRAADTMDPKYLLQGLTLNPAKQAEEWELCKKYAPIAQWKDYGFFDIGVGPSMKRLILGNDTLKDKIADIGMQPASMGDTIAWVRLWYASQAQVKAEHPELEVGSEEFYEESGRVFSHVIDTTQVVDSVLHRSDIMKDKSTTVKNATAFLSEPTKTYNMLFRAANHFVNAQGPEKRKAGKALASTLLVWIASQMVNSAVASLASAFRMHDKDKDLKEKYIEKVVPDFIESIQLWNSIPMVKDWLSALMNNEQDDDATYSILSLIPNVITELKKAAEGKSKKGWWGLLYQASQLTTFWGGNNFQNPLRDIDGIIDNVIIGDDMRKYYPYQRAKYNMYAEQESSSGSISYPNLKMFVATAMKAYAKGDTELGDMIVRDLKKKIPEEKIDNIFSNALKEEEGIKTLAQASLDGNEQQAAAARSELLSKGYSEEMIDKRLDSAFQEIVGSSEDIATSFVEKSEGWEDQLREFANYKTLQGKDKKEIRSSLKNAVTKAYADDYRAENAAGKKDIKDKLLSLSYDGEKLYSESDFTKKNSTWNK